MHTHMHIGPGVHPGDTAPLVASVVEVLLLLGLIVAIGIGFIAVTILYGPREARAIFGFF